MRDDERIITNPAQASLNFAPEVPYTVRRSPRAKRLRINARRDKGIEVVLPRRMALRHVEPFVQQHRNWILQQIQRLGLDQPVTLPDRITLAAISESWPVEIEIDQGKTFRLQDRNGELILKGPDSDIVAHQKKLNQWLRRQAQRFLPDRLYDISTSCQLPYQKVTIRSQRGRWGSCSSNGSINLNDRLMFLPSEIVEYVMIHELCHTQHLNHSPAFWQLVGEHCPEYKSHNKYLRKNKNHLPNWL